MRQIWLVLALALALPALPAPLWPVVLGLIYFTRPGLAQLALLVLLCLRLGLAWPTLEGWVQVGHDRMVPGVAVYPDLISPDHPQILTVYAPRSSHLTAHWQGNQLPLPTTEIGHGIFRVAITNVNVRPGSGLEVEADKDGHRLLPLRWNPSKARPAALSSLPQKGLAAAVSESSDEILLLNREAKVWRFACGDGPTCCQFLPGGRLLAVGTRYSQDLEVLDLNSGKVVARWPQPDPVECLSLSQDALWLAVVAGRHVQFRSLPDLRVEDEIELPEPGELAVFAGRHLVVSSRPGRALFRIDRTQHWTLHPQPRPLARPALGLSLGKNSEEVWLASTSAQLNGGHQKGNHFVLNCLLRLDVPGWQLHSPLSTELRNSHQGGPGSVSSGCGPEGLTSSSDGRILLVYSGSHEVAARDPVSGDEKRYPLAQAELLSPRFVADLGKDVWVVSFPAQHLLGWVSKGEILHKVQFNPMDLADHGEIDFYEATQSGISCQSCHTRGDSDYARHDIGGYSAWGTLSCQGISHTAPYLRNGSYARMQDLHEVAEGLYRNYERVSQVDRRQSLQAYLESLVLPENPHCAEITSLRRGCELFFSQGCAECHTPPRFTNCASLPNQNLFPGQPEFEWLDVPSLHGLWRSAPYLHDHRAAHLSDLWVDQNPANRHGTTRGLSQQHRSDLEQFLLCL